MISNTHFNVLAAGAALAGLSLLSAGNVHASMVTNGDFSSNAAAYTTYPGYSASPNPTAPTGWAGINGVNGPDTGFYINGDPSTGANKGTLPFASGSDTINGNLADFAFMQNNGANVNQTVATAAGQAYTLTYYGAARSGETSDAMDVILTDTIANTQFTTQIPAIVDTGWTAFTLNFTAPSTSTNIEFLNATTASAGGTVDVTNVAMVAVPEPATLGLVMVGGLGLLLLKRRCDERADNG